MVPHLSPRNNGRVERTETAEARIKEMTYVERLLKNVSLQWKVAAAALVSLAACLVFVWYSFSTAVGQARTELWSNAQSMAQTKVNSDLGAAEALYDDLCGDIDMGVAAIARSADLAFHVATRSGDIGPALQNLGAPLSKFVSFLCVVDARSGILGRVRVVETAKNGRGLEVLPLRETQMLPAEDLFNAARRDGALCGAMVLSPQLLQALGLQTNAAVTVVETAGARPPDMAEERRGLVLGSLHRVAIEGAQYLVFGGRLLNNDTGFVDRLRSVIYGDDVEGKAGAGTATVFLHNLRISTNVYRDDRRAVGTLLSIPVEQAVLRDGMTYRGRATVVGHDFFTAYRPLDDVLGNRVGALYVGVPIDVYNAPHALVAGRMQADMRTGFLEAVAFGIIVALLIAFLAGRFFNRPLVALKQCADTVAEGKLQVAVDIDGADEIGRLAEAFRRMADNLRTVVGSVASAAVGIGATSTQIGKTMREHGSTTAQQSAAVSETTATLEELAASSRQIADSAQNVVRMATKTLDSARRGVDISQETLERMTEIRRADDDDIVRIRTLSEKLQRIDEIMSLINSIADQTRLIAFNAAIEAAAAGEAGKRFGVVSAEIRRLAATTRDRANEIRNYVGEILDATASLVVSRERTGELVQSGLEATTNVRATLDQIRSDSESVLTSSQQISTSTQQQRTATEQTLSAVREINDGVNLVAQGAQETEASMMRLADLARELQSLVRRFDV